MTLAAGLESSTFLATPETLSESYSIPEEPRSLHIDYSKTRPSTEMASVDPSWLTIGLKGTWQVIPIKDCSDGEQRHWPANNEYRPSSEEKYLITLGTAWTKSRGFNQDINYYVERLPRNYGVFETSQRGQQGGSQVYKRLFGHPSGKYYDSTIRYIPHFVWLMDGMQGACECVLCSRRTDGSLHVAKPRIPNVVRPKPRTFDRSLLDPHRTSLPSRLPRTIAKEASEGSRDSSATGIAPARARRDVRNTTGPPFRDEEGNEDVFKTFLTRLHRARDSKRGVDEDVQEINSIDWRSEHAYNNCSEDDILPVHLTRIEQQHCFTPRLGELVLWIPDFLDGHHLMLDTKSLQYKFFDFEQKKFHGFPAWRAGVVTAVPSSTVQNGPVDFADLLDVPDKKTALNTTGFRIETLPDPNDALNKAVSKQWKYVPLRNIRPLSHWQVVLRGIDERKLHPSIKSAFTCMTSISLVEKFKATGQWPEASIYCKAMYIGSELITVSDTVRLKSLESPNTCTDVMIVDSIRLNLEGIKEEHVEPTSPFLSSRSSITLVGRAYSLDPANYWDGDSQQEVDRDPAVYSQPQQMRLEEVKILFRPVGSAEYGDWYAMQGPHFKSEVSHEHVLGRLYEADAVRLWTSQLQNKPGKGATPSDSTASMDFDVGGIVSARRYATATDARMPEPQNEEVQWYWADTRAEALAIETFNGYEIGRYHDLRDQATLNRWREQLAIIDGKPITSDALKLTATPTLAEMEYNAGGRKVGRKVGSKLIDGHVRYPGDPEYEAVYGSDVIVDDARAKPASQMAGAILASTDEDDLEDDAEDDIDAEANATNDKPEDTGEEYAMFLTEERLLPHRPPASKHEIMTGIVKQSIEGVGDLDDDVLASDDDLWWEKPLPPARGGTEESSGGDFDPNQLKRARRHDDSD